MSLACLLFRIVENIPERRGVHKTREACIAMENWGLHWHWNNLSLVNRRGQSATRWPWTDPANAFAAEYSYERGLLPNCDDLASRLILLTIASCLTEDDEKDIVEAYEKVANALL